MYLSNALSVPVFYYSHLLNVCEFNAAKIFLLESKGCGKGGGGDLRGWATFTVNTLGSEVRKSYLSLNYMYLFLPESISKLLATVDIGYHTFGSCYMY